MTRLTPILACVLCAAALAQTPSPKEDPTLTNPSTDDLLKEQQRRRPDIPPVEPNKPRAPQRALPALTPPNPRDAGIDPSTLPAARFYPEGTLVTDRRGTLFVSDHGDVILVPANTQTAPMDPLFVVLPCQRLSQMIAARAAGGPNTPFIIAGQVFVYRDRQFLLPSVFAIDRAVTAPTPPAPAAAPSQPAPSPPAPANKPAATSDDPRVNDLIRELESQREAPRRVAAAPTPGAAAPQPTPAAQQPADTKTPTGGDHAIKPEGTLLISRRGRLVRLTHEQGRLAFAVDNDPDSPATHPYLLQPCQLLERMESVASTRGDSLVFRVSGRVGVYEGKNYLLPTFQQVVPPSDIHPMQ
ncbi:MAG: hypothetical protein JSR77_02695 [Planctomycetes bacterium]|nr:hypothetical protein [Planctomycetota bacterium]